MTLRLFYPEMKMQFLFTCAKQRFLLLLFLWCCSTTALLAQTTWTGTNGTSWTDAENWSAGVPDATDDVTIPNVSPQSQPTIGAGTAAVAKSVEVQSGAILNIAATGSLTINGFSSHNGSTTGLFNAGTVANSGIILGSTASVGQYGLYNTAAFNNNSGGEIIIDQSINVGLLNNSGIFTNAAKITIGAVASVGGEGIRNSGTFNNNSGGEIGIDRATTTGLTNVFGTFTNAAKITIRAVVDVGGEGIYNEGQFNNSTCAALIRISSDAIVKNVNTYTFTNAGLLIENAIQQQHQQ